MAKRLCGSGLSAWSVLTLSALSLSCLLAPTVADAAVGRTSGSFNVSANGAATYTIPIFTPPGPRGVQPPIALTYNSNSKQGYVGLGWSISGLSSISRCKRTFAQDGYSEPITPSSFDAYCLNGNRLRLQSGTYGASGSVYYTEMADFSRTTAGVASGSGGYGPLSWTVETKDGLIYTYGGTSDSRAVATSSTYYGDAVLQWMISEIRDRAGNKVKFTWKTADSTTYRMTHPVKIEWTQTSAGSGSYVYSMDFGYSAGGNASASAVERYIAGYIVKDSDLLTGITVNVSGTVKRKYVLTYENSPTTTAKRLTQVKECSDGGASDCLSPTVISYQDNTTGVNTSSPILSISGDVTQADGNHDFNGDGILDVAYYESGTWYVRFGSASSGYGSAINTGSTDSGFRAGRLLGTNADQLLSASGSYVYSWNGSSFSAISTGIAGYGDIVVADVNADGLDDLSYLAGASINPTYSSPFAYYPSLFMDVRVNTTTGGSLSFSSAISLDVGAPSTTWLEGWQWSWEAQEYGFSYGISITGATLSKGGNKNADGRQALNLTVDFLYCNHPSDYPFEYLPSCFDSAYSQETHVVEFSGTGSSLAAFLRQSYPYVAATLTESDFNGDGCDDYLFSDLYGAGATLSGCAAGNWGSLFIGGGYLNWFAGAADWTGDGNPDVFELDGTNLYVRSFQGGDLSARVNTGISVGAYGCTVISTDGNGDGLDDFGCLEPGVGLTIYPHNGTNLAPDVVASITDGFGVTHTPTYTRIERSNYSANNDAVYPARDVTRGRYVVKNATATDGIGGTFNTEYKYFGAQVNLQGRGFSGFEKIQTVDSRNGVMSEQKFKREFPYSGAPYEVNVYQSVSGALMNKRTITMASSTLDATTHNQRYFIYASATAEETYEVGGSSNGQLIQQSSTSNTYDSWGNLTASTGTVTDKDPGSPLYDQTWTTATSTTIYPNTTYWCLGLPSASSVTQSSSVSGESTVVVTKGFSTDDANCRTTAETVGSGALQVDTGYGFDGFGNVDSVSVTGRNSNNTYMTARTASINWGTTGQFPVSETNALSQTTTRTIDSTFGSLLTETDPNSIVVANNEYDAFGRITRSIRADGTATRTTYAACATHGCQNGDPASGTTGINKTIVIAAERDTSDALVRDSWTYLDQFDRPIVEYQQPTGWGYNRIGRQYDAMGRVYRETAPCMNGSCTAYWVTNTYDLMGRAATQSRPQSQSVSTPVTTSFGYAGRTRTITDPQSKVTTKILDVKGQMRRSQDHNGYYQNFAYDAAGGLKEVTDSLSNTLFTASYSYGIRPFQTATTDMDLGNWSYTYNSLGELVEWQDAKSQSFTQTYDALSRVTSRTEAEGTTTFTYGTSAGSHNIGQLASASMTGYSESLSYDGVGRPSTRSITTDQNYDIDYAYTNQGLVDTVTYPTSTASTRVKVKYGYTYGILQSVTDWTSGSAGTVYWTANTRNARGQTTQETLGNGVVTNRSFDAVTGWMNSLQSAVGGGTALQNQSYLYDLIGNITQRQENTQGLTENFYYDNLYRLDYSQLNSSTNLDLTYDAMGNITARSDVNGNATWTYHSTKKHAVATTGSGGSSYSYDANGNMTSRAGSTITWSSYNYPTGLTTSTEGATFYYGPDRQYYRQDYTGPGGTEVTHYVGGLLEKVYDGSVTDWRHQIRANGQVVAIVSRKSTSTNAVYYPLEDHQGSSSVLTDGSGTNLVRQSYNAFGLPRDGSDWDGAVPSGDKATINGISRRGYTGHSMLGDMGLIHMNGRVQDAITGRFLSPDPTIPHPDHTQSYNRYAYVRNNPLSFIDPSGFADSRKAGEFGGGSEDYWRRTQQLLDSCAEADDVQVGEGYAVSACAELDLDSLRWVVWYSMYWANIDAMNRQVAWMSEDQEYRLNWEREHRRRGQITLEPMRDSQTGEIIPEPQGQATRGFMPPVPAPVLEVGTSLVARTLQALAGGLGLLLFPSTTGRDDEAPNRAFHYTTYAAWSSMQQTGLIVPGTKSGYAWFTPTIYDNSAAARSALALDKSPEGYIVFSYSNVRTPVYWTQVAPANGQQGGGIEGRTPAPIPISGAKWVPFRP